VSKQWDVFPLLLLYFISKMFLLRGVGGRAGLVWGTPVRVGLGFLKLLNRGSARHNNKKNQSLAVLVHTRETHNLFYQIHRICSILLSDCSVPPRTTASVSVAGLSLKQKTRTASRITSLRPLGFLTQPAKQSTAKTPLTCLLAHNPRPSATVGRSPAWTWRGAHLLFTRERAR
jgi:hypothetical protein